MYMYHNDDQTRKRSVVTIKNKDNACLPRAIVVALAHLNKMKNKGVQYYERKYDVIRNSRNVMQGELAKRLRTEVGIGNRVGTLADIKSYEDYLRVSINVISMSCNKKVIKSSEIYQDKIYLLHSQDSVFDTVGHFNAVTNVNGVLGVQYYCEICAKGFKNRDQHKCKVWCNVCGRGNCVMKEVQQCSDCNRVCRLEKCFRAHKRKSNNGRGANKGKSIPSLCEQNWQCPHCDITMKTDKRNQVSMNVENVCVTFARNTMMVTIISVT